MGLGLTKAKISNRIKDLMEIDMAEDKDDDRVVGQRPGGKKKKAKRSTKEERTQAELERRERVIVMMKEHGFPITDEAVIDYMERHLEALENVYANVGRPSKYFQELDEWVIWLGNRGYSLKQIASMMGVSHETLYQWGRDFPSFSDALARAREGAQSWWETIGQAALFADRFNTFIWNKIVSNRFRQDYTDRKGLPYDPKAPDEVIVESVLEIDPRLLTAKELEIVDRAIAKTKAQESE